MRYFNYNFLPNKNTFLLSTQNIVESEILKSPPPPPPPPPPPAMDKKKKNSQQIKMIFALSLSDVVFIMVMNVKMSTIVGILTFMSRINFVLSWVEHGKSFIISGPGLEDCKLTRFYCNLIL